MLIKMKHSKIANQDMTLEEYKKKVIELLKMQYPDFTDTLKSLEDIPKSGWQQYMDDFSPEIAVQGIISGLI